MDTFLQWFFGTVGLGLALVVVGAGALVILGPVLGIICR